MERDEATFKARILAANPALYVKLYEEDPRDGVEVEEIVPETPEDVAQMLNELRRAGIVN